MFDLCEVIIYQELTQSQDALRQCLLSEQVFETILIQINLEDQPQQDCVPSGERHLRHQYLNVSNIISVLLSSQLPRHVNLRTRF